MSVTKDFEAKVSPAGFIDRREIVALEAQPLRELLVHTRALEAMLKEHQFCQWSSDPGDECPECGQSERYGHKPDCKLAKLLEGVE